jgi:hypothetical protein
VHLTRLTTNFLRLARASKLGEDAAVGYDFTLVIVDLKEATRKVDVRDSKGSAALSRRATVCSNQQSVGTLRVS